MWKQWWWRRCWWRWKLQRCFLTHQQVQSEGIRKQNMSKYLIILMMMRLQKCCLVDLGGVQWGFQMGLRRASKGSGMAHEGSWDVSSGIMGRLIEGLGRVREGSWDGWRVPDASCWSYSQLSKDIFLYDLEGTKAGELPKFSLWWP